MIESEAMEKIKAARQRVQEVVSSIPQPPAVEMPPVGNTNTVVLDQLSILEIDLLMTKKALAEREAQLAEMQLRDALNRIAQYKTEEAALLSRIARKVGKPITGDIKLLDREKGLCALG